MIDQCLVLGLYTENGWSSVSLQNRCSGLHPGANSCFHPFY